MDTLKLTTAWDLDVNADGSWATVGSSDRNSVVGAGTRLAQDVASRCLTWGGEIYYDTTQGIRYAGLMGSPPNLPLLNAIFNLEALKVPLCKTALANLTFTANTARRLGGQITVADVDGAGGSISF